MKKTMRLFSVLLAALMLLAVGATAVSATETDAPTPTVYANAGNITVDGSVDLKTDGDYKYYEDIAAVIDTALAENIYMGASWGSDAEDNGLVYLQVYAVNKNLTAVALTVNGNTATMTAGVETAAGIDGLQFKYGTTTVGEPATTYTNILELAIPMAAFNFTAIDTDVTAPLKVEVTSDAGNGSFDGNIAFTANEVFMSHTILKHRVNDAPNEYAYGTTKGTWGSGHNNVNLIKTEYTEGRRISISWAEGIAATSSIALVYNEMVGIATKNMDVAIELDVKVDSLPYGAPETKEVIWGKDENPSHILFQIGRGLNTSSKAEQIMLLVLYNSEQDGLVLYRDINEERPTQALALGKTEGEQFTLTMRWKANNELAVYVDGVLKGTYPAMADDVYNARNNWNDRGYGFYINLVAGNNLPQDGSKIAAATFTNVHAARGADFDPVAFMALANGTAGEGEGEGGNGGEGNVPDDGNGDEGNTPTENNTQAPTGNETNAPAGNETNAPATEAPAATDEGGCQSVASAFAVVALASLAGVALTRKKK